MHLFGIYVNKNSYQRFRKGLVMKKGEYPYEGMQVVSGMSNEEIF